MSGDNESSHSVILPDGRNFSRSPTKNLRSALASRLKNRSTTVNGFFCVVAHLET
jgi:hypothetical protein